MSQGILELTDEAIDQILSETREKGAYKTLLEEFKAGEARGIDVTEKFKQAKPDSVYQGLRKEIKNGNGAFEGITVKNYKDRILVIRLTENEPVVEDDTE